MAKAKKTIGQVACIEGNVPLSLIYAGTAEETAAYVRNLIDVAGEGGGYILNIGAVTDDGKDENLRAMIDTALEVRPVLMRARGDGRQGTEVFGRWSDEGGGSDRGGRRW